MTNGHPADACRAVSITDENRAVQSWRVSGGTRSGIRATDGPGSAAPAAAQVAAATLAARTRQAKQHQRRWRFQVVLGKIGPSVAGGAAEVSGNWRGRGPTRCVGPTAFVNASAPRLHLSPSKGRKQQQRIGPMARMRRTKAHNFGPNLCAQRSV